MTGDGLTLGLLGESALRTLLLGAVVFGLLKLARMRDLRTETAIWTVVLLVALSMPLLSLWRPGGIAVTLPRLTTQLLPAAAHAPVVLAVAQTSPHAPARLLAWSAAHAAQLLRGLYLLVALAGLARLITGLILTLELYRAAEPIEEDWARGKSVRASAAITGPLSFAHCILLPADYRGWSPAKRLAVLAHEESHIRRGDFFIQLLASAHRAVFWFSPFAWWLQHRLGELAETASDEAAIRRINDPAGYAEILIEVARQARPWQATVAMARGPGVAKRIDHILSGAREKSLGAVGRIAVLSLVLTSSLAFAQVHAVIAPDLRNPPPMRMRWTVSDPSPPAPRGEVHAVRSSSPRTRAKAAIAATLDAAAPAPQADFTYNPRALLDEPEADIIPAIVFSGGRSENGRLTAQPSLQGE
jgi:beta-lactamase regulating signal transducer with metallopeptidase domain